MRICRNQEGRRIYDAEGTKEGKEINLLTVVPNETYETFAAQYQEQIKEIYGTAAAGSSLRKKHKGKDNKNIVRRTKLFESNSFKAFWTKLARKTNYTVAFREPELVKRAIDALNTIAVPEYEAEIVLTRIKGIFAESLDTEEIGRESEKLKASFSPLDLIEEISENTSLSYPTVMKIVAGLDNLERIAKNPARFLAEACAKIRGIELDEMLRALSYHPTGDSIPLARFEPIIETLSPTKETPNHGVYDHVILSHGSKPEKEFATAADNDNEVICFLKLPDFYEIPTPIGMYRPDFGLVLKRRGLKEKDENEYYFVVETKSTNDISDSRALTDAERYKIRCALKHFEAVGLEAELKYEVYRAPVKDYRADFKDKLPI